MKIALFNNKKGLIHGGDPKRICCDKEGVLKIGTTDISLTAGDNIMPLLFHGATGNYDASFTDANGNIYVLDTVTVKAGRIAAPSETKAEIMELHSLLDQANDKADRLQAKINELENIFDTNSLNFLIK